MIFLMGALKAKNGVTSAHARRQAGAMEGYSQSSACAVVADPEIREER